MPDPKDRQHHHPVAGRRANVLSVVSVSFLAVFVLIVCALLVSDVVYLLRSGLSAGKLWEIFASRQVLAGIRMSVLTSLVTVALVIVFAVPVGYALSRFRFRGHSILNTIVDVPIVLPPVVIGLSLLAFFGTGAGGWIKDALRTGGWSLRSAIGIVLCQFLVSVSYCIRATKASFDGVDRTLEQVALSLGCSQFGAFRRVTLPLSRSGLVAGAVMAWARAIGVFGPLMVFVGTSPRVQVMPTAMWLEMSVGNIETSLAIALVSVALAGAALLAVHKLAPGRTWT